MNTVGKCVWETVVDLKAKPSFTIPPGLRDPITFQEDEIIRIKLPLIGVPEPTLALDRIDKDGKEVAVMASESDAADKEEADLQVKQTPTCGPLKCLQNCKKKICTFRMSKTRTISSPQCGAIELPFRQFRFTYYKA